MENAIQATAQDVARYFLHLAAHGREPVPLTQMHLHKLLYYAQGWSLATRGRPLFAEPIEAWQHGPVVASLYATFKPYGRDAIDTKESAEPDILSAPDRAFLASVWSMYRRYSAIELRRRTHAEPPWKEARAGIAPDVPSKQTIPTTSLRAFFVRERERHLRRMGIEPAAWSASMEQSKRGETVDVNLADPRDH